MEKSEKHLLREHAKRAGRERGEGGGLGEGRGETGRESQLNCTSASLALISLRKFIVNFSRVWRV